MQAVFSWRALQITLLVVVVRIYGAVIESPLPDGVFPVALLRRELALFGIPDALLIAFLPFIAGFTMGSTVGYVGASFPLALSLLGPSPSLGRLAATTVLAYGFGFMGELLSPVHVCLVVTAEYFQIRLLRSLSSLIAPALLVLAGVTLWQFALRWLLPGGRRQPPCCRATGSQRKLRDEEGDHQRRQHREDGVEEDASHCPRKGGAHGQARRGRGPLGPQGQLAADCRQRLLRARSAGQCAGDQSLLGLRREAPVGHQLVQRPQVPGGSAVGQRVLVRSGAMTARSDFRAEAPARLPGLPGAEGRQAGEAKPPVPRPARSP